MRIAARMHPDGRLEFGIQRLDDEGTPRLLHLEHERFFPRDVTHNRWLEGSATFLLQAPYYDFKGRDPAVPVGTHAAAARVIARVHPSDGRVEFALQPSWTPSSSAPTTTTTAIRSSQRGASSRTT